MAGVLKNQAEPICGGGGVNACLRVVVCLLVAASAFSLAPGTALAQTDTTPPTVERSQPRTDNWIVLQLTEEVHLPPVGSFSVIVDGENRTVLQFGHATVGGVEDHSTVALQISSNIPEGAEVFVSYIRPASGQQLRDRSSNMNAAESFAWDVANSRHVSVEQVVYTALGWYFDGSGSLSSAEMFVSDYLQNLNAKILAEGGVERVVQDRPA